MHQFFHKIAKKDRDVCTKFLTFAGRWSAVDAVSPSIRYLWSKAGLSLRCCTAGVVLGSPGLVLLSLKLVMLLYLMQSSFVCKNKEHLVDFVIPLYIRQSYAMHSIHFLLFHQGLPHVRRLKNSSSVFVIWYYLWSSECKSNFESLILFSKSTPIIYIPCFKVIDY